MAKPLNELKGKKEWKWEMEHQEAFDELKEKIASQPVLALPKREGKFQVETNASEYAIGGVLSQGEQKSIAFLSRTMQHAERNYKIYDKELLTIVEALIKQRQYLLDITEKFEVWTDHENLKYFWELHKINRRQARQYLKLQDYDFTLYHILGKINTKADVLLRKDQVDMKEYNKDILILKIQTRRQITAEVTLIQKNQVVEEITLLEGI